MTILCGRSGVGKTSLIQAGLIPSLEQVEKMVAAYARCGEDPERSIINALHSRLQMPPTDPEAPIRLADALRETYENNPRPQVIFIDQTEEAFIKLGHRVLQNFAAALEECLSDPAGVTRFVFVIREDFLPRMAMLGERLSGVLSNTCRLDDLSRDAAQAAILKPAALCGVRVEEGLTEAILDDLSPDKVLPAHLQIVCDRVYRACEKEKVMTLTAYQNLGRASAILRNHLESAMSGIPSDLEPAARSVLGALVTSENTKDLLTLEEIAARTDLDLETATRANQDLIHRCRLVREVRDREGFFELSHESLAESVAAWLSHIQARTRAVQELLDREVSTGKKFASHLIKVDRLRLIEEHQTSLSLRPEASTLVIASYVAQREIPEFWRTKLEALTSQDTWEAVFFSANQGQSARVE
jgi:eukaryotic-like serine/threonine-protein kinase